MPEGPEVAVLTESLAIRYSQGWELCGAQLVSGRYAEPAAEPKGWELLAQAMPARLVSVNWHGKFLYFQFESAAAPGGYVWLWSTLGLTGGWSVRSGHPYTRLALTLTRPPDAEGGKHTEQLYFYDRLNYGTLKASSARSELDAKLAKLGASWIGASGVSLTLPAFHALLRKGGKPQQRRRLARRARSARRALLTPQRSPGSHTIAAARET